MSLALAPGRVLVLHAGYNPPSLVALDAASLREVSRLPLEDAWLGLAVHPKGDRAFVSGGGKGYVQEVLLRAGRLEAGRRFPLPKGGFVGDVALSPDARFLYVAQPFRNSLTVMNALTGFVVSEVPAGRRPYRIVFAPDGKTFWVSHVADAAIGQYNAADGQRLAAIPVQPHPADMVFLPGGNEAGAEGRPRFTGRLFVACANTNSILALGLSEGAALSLLARVGVSPSELAPLGSTPAALALSPDGKRLYVATQTGVAVVDIADYDAELAGFVPSAPAANALRVAPDGRILAAAGTGRQPGSLTVFSPPREEDLAPPAGLPSVRDWASPPIQHVVYVLTSPSPEPGPNARRLAQEFVRLDQFFALGDSPWEGYQWATAGIVNHLVRKLAPAYLAGRSAGEWFAGPDPALYPPAGYLWTNALSAGLTVRDYGLVRGRDPGLAQYSKPAAALFTDLAAMVRAGAFPQLVLVRLSGPEFDAGLGRLLDLVRSSPAWPRMAVFVAPEYADPPDRPAPALIASPFARRGYIERARYDTLSMLRTIELLLGLQPMTQFDGAAAPMSACFASHP